MSIPVRRRRRYRFPSRFRKFGGLFSMLNVQALRFLCVVKWANKTNLCRAGWTCTEDRDVFSPSSKEGNRSDFWWGQNPCPRVPVLLGSPVVKQIRKSSEQFIFYSESVFCSAETDCSSGQFQVLTAGPRSPLSPPLPFCNERGEAWMHIEQWS